MSKKLYTQTSFVLFLFFSINHPIPCGIIASGISEDAFFMIAKNEFYERVYTLDFSEELLKECIYFEKIQHPEIVLNQARLETGNFTSEIFWVSNNCFGMRLARVRETTAIAQYLYHARYSNWTESVKDYKLWQDYYLKRGYDTKDYFTFLKGIGYATDPNYIRKICDVS